VFIWIGRPLELRLGGKDTVLLLLTVVVSSLTSAIGRTTVLQGVVHLAIFLAYLFLSFVPWRTFQRRTDSDPTRLEFSSFRS